MTRSDWMLLALHAEIERRRPIIDADNSIKEAILVVQFPSKPDGVGGIKCKFEHGMTLVKIEGLDKGNGG